MRKRLLFMLLLLAYAKLTTAQFVHVQGNASGGGGSTTTATSISDPLTRAPTANHLLVFWMFLLSSDGVTPITNVSVSDSKGHAFTLTPISAANSGNGSASAGQVFAGYILKAPSGMSSTINATWTGNATAYRETLYVDEYSYTGTVAFDKEAAYISVDHSVIGTAINQPSITPSVAGELLYAGAQGTSQITTGTQGLWTMSGGGYSTYDSNAMTQYISSSPLTSTAINLTQQNDNYWDGYIMAFSLGGGAPTRQKRRSPGVF